MNENYLQNIKKPFRYLGCEVGITRKSLDEVDLRFALVSPDIYDLGMSHLGIKIIYAVLNSLDGVYAERFFSPWLDMEEFLRKKKKDLLSLETQSPLREFDIIGFSILYELSYTNILNILDLAGIPFLSSERGEDYPLIIGGGPSVSNPEPMADFFDAFFIGDGEEGVKDIVEVYRSCKSKKSTKPELLYELSSIEGIYVPSFFKAEYGNNNDLLAVTPLSSHKVKRRILNDLEKSPYPITQPVPYGSTTHNRLAVEISRGCSRGCRFCQAGFIYRPVRERNPKTVCNIIDRGLKNTGYDEVSLLSLSSGDYTSLLSLVSSCSGFIAKKISISMPSLRVGTVDKKLLEEIKKVRKTGFTIAPEAGSQKLRDSVNKNITEDEIMETCGLLFEEGWELIKLYFMIGLPGETKEDVEAIVDLVLKIRSMGKTYNKRVRLNVAISPFVPKPHTPFQWVSQDSIAKTSEKLSFLKRALKIRGVQLKWQNPDVSFIEGVFSRGDRRLGRAVVRAWEMGARFDGWTEQFNFDLWMNAFKEAEITPDNFLSEKVSSAVLSWDHIDVGISKKFLEDEMSKTVTTPDCRKSGCYDCGVCSESVTNLDASVEEAPPVALQLRKTSLAVKSIFRYRFVYKKEGRLGLLSHLELLRTFLFAIRRADLPVRYSQGFNPHVKISFGVALPLGMESFCEMFDLETVSYVTPDVLRSSLNENLPPELEILSVEGISSSSSSITSCFGTIHYSAELPSGWEDDCSKDGQLERLKQITATSLQDRVDKYEDLLGEREIIIEKVSPKKGKRTRLIDIKPMLSSASFEQTPCFYSKFEVLFVPNSYVIKPWDILKTLFGFTEEDKGLFVFKKIDFLFS